eukprot:TRINITY_DN5157_c0_g1_i1.p1 TRINITY_DN5157_c0_g1~~TRINITY_DN5157_c0_g1_i1.p1  ORF type:complete len:684 (+),score=109.72 TRINITY_DN5157_c0_g1_i1:1191-3242(+)
MQFDSWDLASTVWSLASSAYSDASLLTAIASRVVRKIDTFVPQALSNTAWAFATLKFLDETLAEAIASRASKAAYQFSTQDLANTAWSFASLRWLDLNLMEAISTASRQAIHQFRPQELSSTAWSFAKLNVKDVPLLNAIASSALLSFSDESQSKYWRSQEVANIAWAFARLSFQDDSIMKSLASRLEGIMLSSPDVPMSFDLSPKHVDMVIWSLSRRSCLELAFQLFRAWFKVASTEKPKLRGYGGLALAGLLAECERRSGMFGQTGLGCPGRRGERMLLKLLPTLDSWGGSSVSLGSDEVSLLTVPARNVFAMKLAETGASKAAVALLKRHSGDDLSQRLAKALGINLDIKASQSNGMAPQGLVGERGKEARLWVHVLANASPGDPASICQAIEEYGLQGLSKAYGGYGGKGKSEGKWLKVAGGEKRSVLELAASLAPNRAAQGRTLEVGTYCGYSSLRIAKARPGGRILSLEADAGTAVIARNVFAFAGMNHLLDVRIGHSEDVIPLLGDEGWGGTELKPPFDLVFFDQRGSRYVADLKLLEESESLLPGAVIVADNVLKPGAPAFLWHLLKSGWYETKIISVTEYAMPGVEDWMSISIYRKQAGKGEARSAIPPLPNSLRRLEWEADQMRARADRIPGVGFEAWKQFAAQMREALAQEGIFAEPLQAAWSEALNHEKKL